MHTNQQSLSFTSFFRRWIFSNVSKRRDSVPHDRIYLTWVLRALSATRVGRWTLNLATVTSGIASRVYGANGATAPPDCQEPFMQFVQIRWDFLSRWGWDACVLLTEHCQQVSYTSSACEWNSKVAYRTCDYMGVASNRQEEAIAFYWNLPNKKRPGLSIV